MYAQSITRQFAVASLLVAAFAGILAAEVTPYPQRPGAGVPYAGQTAGTLPLLPEIVVTAPRLEA